MIKAVIFDMDGLLIDSEPFWHKSERAAFSTVGIEMTGKILFEQTGTRIDEVVAHRFRLKPWQGPSQKDIEAKVVDGVIDLIKNEGQLMPGVIDTLELLRERSIPMAVASSSPMEIIDTVLVSLNIRDYFDYVHSAEHERHGKPHPAVFISTADLFQIPAHQILIFEDAPAGVLAAKAAKMHCIAVPHKTHNDNKFIQIADIIIESLEEFDDKMLDSL